MNVDPPASVLTPADELRGTVAQALGDLAELGADLPVARSDERAARILTRLAEELAEAAHMTRALPARLAVQPGHTYAAHAALATALGAEPDFSGWLAGVLAAVTAPGRSDESLNDINRHE